MRRTVHETSGPTVLLFVHLSRPTRVWSHFSSRPSRDVVRSVVGERASVGSRRSVSCFPPARPGVVFMRSPAAHGVCGAQRLT